jgi:hypothetical protein
MNRRATGKNRPQQPASPLATLPGAEQHKQGGAEQHKQGKDQPIKIKHRCRPESENLI